MQRLKQARVKGIVYLLGACIVCDSLSLNVTGVIRLRIMKEPQYLGCNFHVLSPLSSLRFLVDNSTLSQTLNLWSFLFLFAYLAICAFLLVIVRCASLDDSAIFEGSSYTEGYFWGTISSAGTVLGFNP